MRRQCSAPYGIVAIYLFGNNGNMFHQFEPFCPLSPDLFDKPSHCKLDVSKLLFGHHFSSHHFSVIPNALTAYL
jgi:hypothetical protein